MCLIIHLILLLGLKLSLAEVPAALGSGSAVEDASVDKSLVAETMQFLTHGDARMQLSENHKRLTLLVGLKGSGKSTMAHFLSHRYITLEAYATYQDIFIRDAGNNVSSSLTSGTLFPELILDHETGEAMYDCPGFKDTRITSVEIVNGFFIKQLVKHASSVKILVVVKYDAVKLGGSRGWFTSLVAQLLQFMRNVPNYKGAIALLVTKVDVRADDQKALNRIVGFIKKAHAHSLEQFPDRRVDLNALFNSWMEQDSEGNYLNLDFIRQPERVGRLSDMPEVTANRQRLGQMVFNNTHFAHVPCNASDFGIPPSEEAITGILEIQSELINQVNQGLDELIAGIRAQIIATEATATKAFLSTTHFDASQTALIKVEGYSSVSCTQPPTDVLEAAIDMAKSLGVPRVHELSRNLTQVYRHLKYLDLLQSEPRAVNTVEYCKQKERIVKEVEDVSSRMKLVTEETAVLYILTDQPGTAVSWLNKLHFTGDLVVKIIDKAYSRLPETEHPITRYQHLTALPIVNFLAHLKTNQPLATHGVLHLIGKIASDNLWSGVYLPLHQLLRQLEADKSCLTNGVQIRVFLCRHELKEARAFFVPITAKLIVNYNPGVAKHFFDFELGGDEKETFISVVKEAVQLNRLFDTVKDVFRFIELFDRDDYAIAGVEILFYAMKREDLIPDVRIFQLRALARSRGLSDSATLSQEFEDAIGQMYYVWSQYLSSDAGCDYLDELERAHGSDFDAFQIVSLDDQSSTDEIVKCIKRFYTNNTIRGYQGLFRKLNRLDQVDSYDYMDLIEGFKEQVRSHSYSHSTEVSAAKAEIPTGIRNFFFCSRGLTIVNRGRCLGVKRDRYLHAASWKYEVDLHPDEYTIECKMTWDTRPGFRAEYRLSSEKTNTVLYVAGGAINKCGYGCRKVWFWGTPGDESEYYNAWFKIKPYSGGSEFSIMNTHYPGALYGEGGVFSEEKSDVYETITSSWELWKFECAGSSL